MTDGRAVLLATLTEAQFQRQVIEWAARAEWRVFHAYDSRRSTGGFPDLVLTKPGQPVIFAELKTTTGRVSREQRIWLDDFALSSSNVLARVWRPTDEDAIKAVLRA